MEVFHLVLQSVQYVPHISYAARCNHHSASRNVAYSAYNVVKAHSQMAIAQIVVTLENCSFPNENTKQTKTAHAAH